MARSNCIYSYFNFKLPTKLANRKLLSKLQPDYKLPEEMNHSVTFRAYDAAVLKKGQEINGSQNRPITYA